MQRLIRMHGNFAEYVPFALLLLFMLDSTRFSPVMIHVLGIMLVVGRIAHAIGFSKSSYFTPGRGIGVVLTLLTILITAVLLLWVFANAECNVLRHGEVREQCIVLEHHADSAFFWREGEPCFGDDFAGQLYLALMHGLKAGDGA